MDELRQVPGPLGPLGRLAPGPLGVLAAEGADAGLAGDGDEAGLGDEEELEDACA
ncbi:hypothetical protein [uncultured Aliiroseovarius sp.]|uniref:hypothetical protein n=1 Tax=uncultured Aliiroseovarius sp. TaxID=1658783 RepID=UPI00262B9FE9|nr:hypothetical protein [uncultured Aliiroseovarius sp.]